MNFNEIEKLDSEYVMHTYARNPVAIDHGHSATVYDTEGRSYVDFTSGIGVMSLGYGNKDVAKAVYEQALKLTHMSNLYYTEPCVRLAEQLCKRAGMKYVFFGNSGAEANEGMIKTARKYSFDRYGKGRSTVITLKQSFHGRTITTLKATGQEHFHDFFYPFTDGFEYATPGDIGEIKGLIKNGDVCAVMIELIQGEGGVFVLPQDYVLELRKLCDENDIGFVQLLIFITGFGHIGVDQAAVIPGTLHASAFIAALHLDIVDAVCFIDGQNIQPHRASLQILNIVFEGDCRRTAHGRFSGERQMRRCNGIRRPWVNLRRQSLIVRRRTLRALGA